MKYIYTSYTCPKCDALKERYINQKIEFEERDAERIKNPTDLIDREAMVIFCEQNETLPVEVEM